MTIEDTLKERGKLYGDFTYHAKICQNIKLVMKTSDKGSGKNSGWIALTDVQKQALETIADKIARILSGDPNYIDNWHDIQGYAKLAEDRCTIKDNCKKNEIYYGEDYSVSAGAPGTIAYDLNYTNQKIIENQKELGKK